jgi:hypothetical protein
MNTFDTDERPTSGESLCESCMWVHMQRGFRESEQTIFCNHAYPMRAVKFAVRECTDYSSRITPSRKEMEEIALIIPVERLRKPAGFAGGNRFVPQDENDENDSVCIME